MQHSSRPEPGSGHNTTESKGGHGLPQSRPPKATSKRSPTRSKG
jgi:hypothetical protein